MNSQNNNKNCNDSVESVVLKNQTPTIDEVKEWQNMRKIAEEFWLKDIKESAQDGSPILDSDNEVNNPSHYQSYAKDLNIDCITAMRAAFGNDEVKIFCKINAFKYIYRSSSKGLNTDINKAIWYLNKFLELGGYD